MACAQYADGTAGRAEWRVLCLHFAQMRGDLYIAQEGTSTALPPGLFIGTPLTSVEIEAPRYGERTTRNEDVGEDYIEGIYYISMSGSKGWTRGYSRTRKVEVTRPRQLTLAPLYRRCFLMKGKMALNETF